MNLSDASVIPSLAHANEIAAHLQSALQTTDIEVLDESEAHAGHAGNPGHSHGTHMRVRLSSPLFAGQGRVAQHRLVYDACQPFFARGLHALAIEVVQNSSPSVHSAKHL
jgi:BolA family transcriptional regulator, general stress-responsive regulator